MVKSKLVVIGQKKEKSLLIGINMIKKDSMEMLKQYYNKLETTNLPDFSGTEKLDDWITNLIHIDAYIAGLACSAVAGEKITKNEIPEINAIQDVLFEITSDNSIKEIYRKKCESYFELLQAIRSLLIEVSTR